MTSTQGDMPTPTMEALLLGRDRMEAELAQLCALRGHLLSELSEVQHAEQRLSEAIVAAVELLNAHRTTEARVELTEVLTWWKGQT